MARQYIYTLKEVKEGVRNHPNLSHVPPPEVNYLLRNGDCSRFPWVGYSKYSRIFTAQRNWGHPYWFNDITRVVRQGTAVRPTVGGVFEWLEVHGENYERDVLFTFSTVFGLSCAVCRDRYEFDGENLWDGNRIGFDRIVLGSHRKVGDPVCSQCYKDFRKFSRYKRNAEYTIEGVSLLWLAEVACGKRKKILERLPN